MAVSEKYFRTYHVPWTKCATKDDKILSSVEHFVGSEVVVTEKMDGENQTWTSTGVYARSHSAQASHASNAFSKAEWAKSQHLIDPNLSVFFEYTYARHSIWYGRMAAERAYIHLIGVRDDSTGIHWAWDDVELMAEVLGYPTVPVLYRGTILNVGQLERLMPCGIGTSAWGDTSEGEVVRLAPTFTDSRASIAKAVRANHVTSDKHWKRNWQAMHDVMG